MDQKLFGHCADSRFSGMCSCGASAESAAADGFGRTKESICSQITPVMAYIPFQTDGKVYCDEQALARGTLYSVLDKPFYGNGGCCGGK